MSGVFTDTYGDIDEFSSGLKDNLDTVFTDKFDSMEFEFASVVHVDDTDEMIINESKYSEPVRTRTVNEGGAFHRVENQQVRTKQFVMEFIKTEFKVTREAIKYQKFKELKDGAGVLARVLHRTIEEMVQSMFIHAFDSCVTPDLLSLCNTLHPLSVAESGYPTTQSNRSNLRLNPTNLKAGKTAMAKHRGERGELSRTRANRLICGPDEEINALHCLQDGYEPFSANLTSNQAAKGLGGAPAVLTYLADSDYPNSWFLQDSEAHMLKMFWGQHPKNWTDKDPFSADFLYRTEAHIMYGPSDPVGIYGNTGEV